MPDTVKSDTHPCRLVTSAEVEHYREYGWAKLDRFVDPEVIGMLLGIARQRMGDDGDSNPPYGINQPYFNAEYYGGLTNPPVRALIDKVGQSARLLMSRGTSVGIKYFTDFFAPKLPSGKQTKNAGNGPTAFHQDFITFAVDRTGGMTFWIALEEYSPDWGTMSFVNRSHQIGILGSYHTYGGGDALDVHPELRDLEMSQQMHYRVGDVTVHSHTTVHGAGKNLMDLPRWAYLILTQPGDVCWNGAPSEAFDPTGMTLNQRLPDERFPMIG